MSAVEIHEITCDRCGETTNHLAGEARPAGWAEVRVNLVTTDVNRDLVVVGTGPRAPLADICPNCCETLIEWWAGRKQAAEPA